MRHHARALLLLGFLALAARANAEAPASTAPPAVPEKIVPAPRLAPGFFAPSGEEHVLLDLAVMPMEFLRRDLNGVLIPGGFRLATWANLASRSFADDRVRIVTSFRFDLDTSATTNEVNAFRPYLSPTRYSLLAAYVEADAGGGFFLRAGRQFHADAADYLAFDGAKVMFTPGRLPLRLELYGGVRSSFAVTTGAVASSLYELDGVQDESETQPLAGAVIRYLGDWRHRTEASVGFRWSWRTPGPDRLADPTLPDTISTTAEELTASAGGDAGPVHLSAAAGYELVLQTLMRARAAATLEFSKLGADPGTFLGTSSFTVEYRRYRPTFALDSIFNYFSLNPYDEYSAGYSAFAGPRIHAEARLFERRFFAATQDRGGNDLTISPGSEGAHGGRLLAWAQLGPVLADALAQFQLGFGGTRLLFDTGGRMPLGDDFALYARASVAHFDVDTRPLTNGTSFGVVAGGTWFLPQGANVSVLIEETVNSYTTRVPRFFGVADLARWL